MFAGSLRSVQFPAKTISPIQSAYISGLDPQANQARFRRKPAASQPCGKLKA
jgi:hypothetical protein